MKFALGVYLTLIMMFVLFVVTFWATVGYIAYHFVTKYW